MKWLMFLLASAAGVVVAADWSAAGVTPTATWFIDKSSLGIVSGPSGRRISANVRRVVGADHASDGVEFTAFMSPDHCDKPRGDLTLVQDGQTFSSVYVKGESTVFASLALAICAAHQRK